MDGNGSVDTREARAALADAAAVGDRMRAHTRGYGVFALVLSALFPTVLLAVAFVPLDPRLLGVGSAIAGALAGTGSAVTAARLTAVPRGFTPRYLTAFLTSSGLYTAVLVLGIVAFRDSAAWWIGGAALTAAPLVVLGGTILRGTRRTAAPDQDAVRTMWA
ncbi:hypothetical protein NI17_001920 [Thermobifida halotolerans]|uniref:Uncharacterized protein n=1 Tax=Thermobifida halotolerans TaxID=483545 RepID=A0A399G4L1_9ACTN|nr:hypothetical protein [Thermobifida halotolerans]UOE20035.1 hypothetical protein NI17_001920 [Thermobifida halotolerans]